MIVIAVSRYHLQASKMILTDTATNPNFALHQHHRPSPINNPNPSNAGTYPLSRGLAWSHTAPT
jgi:hypothetical protein